MLTGLDSFVRRIEGFDSIPSSRKIDIFAYFLTVEKELDGFNSKEINDCYNFLCIPSYSNISAYLSSKSKGKDRRFVIKQKKYYLERTNSASLSKMVGNPVVANVSNSEYFPVALLKDTRGYLEIVGRQAIACYDSGLYDGCLILTRKLIEILIVECFERHSISSTIKGSDGNFFYLSDLVDKLIKEPTWNVSRNTKQSLPKIKKFGDLSAHNRRYTANKLDLDSIKHDLRVVIEEIVLLIDYPNWK